MPPSHARPAGGGLGRSPLPPSGPLPPANVNADPATIKLLRLSKRPDGGVTETGLLATYVPQGAKLELGAPGGGWRSAGIRSFLTQGWHDSECCGTWIDGGRAVLSLPRSMLPRGALKATLDMDTFTGMGYVEGTQTVKVSAQGQTLGEWQYKKGGQRPATVFTLPAGMNAEAGGTLELVFDVDKSYNPDKLGISPGDRRNLGLHVRKIEFAAEPK